MSSQKPKAIYYKILQYQASNLAKLENNFDLITLDTPSADSSDILAEADLCFAPLGYFVDEEKMAKCPKLRVIATNTTGVPHIDMDEASKRDIYVASLKDEQDFLATITPTAEHAWGLLLGVLRNVRASSSSVLDGVWNRRPFYAQSMLSRMSIGIIGYGRLGSIVSRYAQAFGMTVACYDPYVHVTDQNVRQCDSLEELVQGVDVISLHAPALAETHHLLNAGIISKFKHGCLFINSARGELVDENALCAAIKSGQIAGCGVDVLDGEFDPSFITEKHPLVQLAKQNDNVLITPHVGGSTLDAWSETEGRVIDMAIDRFRTLGWKMAS